MAKLVGGTLAGVAGGVAGALQATADAVDDYLDRRSSKELEQKELEAFGTVMEANDPDDPTCTTFEKPCISEAIRNNWRLMQNHIPPFAYENNAVMLLGTSQNGKSLLANWLAYPRLIRDPARRLFSVGTGNDSETKLCQSVQTTWNPNYILSEDSTIACTSYPYIIDTPGLGDANPDKEFLNVLSVRKQLQSFQQNGIFTGLAVLVVKYPCLLTEDYFNNMRIYRKLLPELSSDNILLVITNVKATKEWEDEQRYVSQRDPRDIIQGLVSRIAAELNLDHDVPYLTINAMPFSNADKRHAVQTRDVILEKLLHSPPVTFKLDKVPKPRHVIETHRIQAQGVQNELRAYNEGLTSGDAELRVITDELLRHNSEKEMLKERIRRVTTELEELDTDTKVTLDTHTFNQPWRFFGWATEEFRKQYDIVVCDMHVKGANTTFKSTCPTKVVHYQATSRFFRPLHAILEVFAKSRDKNAVRIAELRGEKARLEERLAAEERDIRRSSTAEQRKKEQLDQLRQRVEEANAQVLELSSDSYSESGIAREKQLARERLPEEDVSDFFKRVPFPKTVKTSRSVDIRVGIKTNKP